MKKILYGSIVLCLFAFTIAIIDISCQKTIGQTTNPPGETNGYILFEKSTEQKVTFTTQTDSGSISTDFSYYPFQYSTTDLNGNNEMQIPITVTGNLYVGDGGKVSSDGSTIVFKVLSKPDETGSQNCYTYACSLDGSNLRKLRDDCQFSDVH